MSATLGSLCSFLSGGTPSKKISRYYTGSIPWITGADIVGPLVTAARSFITEEAIEKSATNLVPEGTVLLVTRTSVGKVAITGTPLCFSQDVTALVPDESKLDASYLVHFLRTKQPHFERIARGATIKGITRRAVTETSIPLPPLPEQKRIAAILDKADALRTKRQTALAKLDELTQSIFLEMFAGSENRPWPVASVSDIVDKDNGSIRTGPFGSQLLHSEFVEEGVAVLGIDNVVANTFQWGERRHITPQKYQGLKRYTVKPGDVLITIMGTCGRCAVVPDDIPLAINTKHLCCISVDQSQITPAFLKAYFLRHPIARRYLERTAKGAIMSGLNMGIIKAMPVLLPPLSLQQTFTARIQALESLKTIRRQTLAAHETLFAALQQLAFTGTL